MKDNKKVFYGKYRGKRIYSNKYCMIVTLGGRPRYFTGADRGQQVLKTMKEIDDYLAGKIE